MTNKVRAGLLSSFELRHSSSFVIGSFVINCSRDRTVKFILFLSLPLYALDQADQQCVLHPLALRCSHCSG